MIADNITSICIASEMAKRLEKTSMICGFLTGALTIHISYVIYKKFSKSSIEK